MPTFETKMRMKYNKKTSSKLLEIRESYEIKKLKERINLQAAFSIFFQFCLFSFELRFCHLRAGKPSVLLIVVHVYLPNGSKLV